jgi:fanconi anemia group J protein
MENKKFYDDYKIMITQNKKIRNKAKTISFLCLHPRVAFYYLKKECRSIILTSGTLSPFESFESELEVEFKNKYEGNHIINTKKQVHIESISKGLNNYPISCVYNETKKNDFKFNIGKIVLNYCSVVKNGILCFFTSYTLLESLYEYWEENGILRDVEKYKDIFIEPRSNSKIQFSDIINDFYNCIEDYENGRGEENKTGGIFFAVFRGNVSEGIDFSDNKARLVINIGNLHY